MDPAIGKILGMAMAYGVSSLGLLLAYYNYRKRVVKAEKIFTPAARAVLAVVIAVVFLAVTLGAVFLSPGAGSAGARLVRHLPGIILPGIIFGFSFWVTWLLFQHFTRKIKSGDVGK
jgi:hypothetical protein